MPNVDTPKKCIDNDAINQFCGDKGYNAGFDQFSVFNGPVTC